MTSEQQIQVNQILSSLQLRDEGDWVGGQREITLTISGVERTALITALVTLLTSDEE